MNVEAGAKLKQSKLGLMASASLKDKNKVPLSLLGNNDGWSPEWRGFRP